MIKIFRVGKIIRDRNWPVTDDGIFIAKDNMHRRHSNIDNVAGSS